MIGLMVILLLLWLSQQVDVRGNHVIKWEEFLGKHINWSDAFPKVCSNIFDHLPDSFQVIL